MLQFTDGERIVAYERAGVRTWLHTDHLGSVVLATDAAGASVLEIAYGPYGNVLSRTGVEVPQGFATGEAMAEGLVLLGVRWYSPHLGRFLSPDSLVGDASDPLAWNAYAYARCNPTSYIDPSGRSLESVAAAVAASIAIIILVIVVSVATFGYGAGAAVVVGGYTLGVTWGAVFTATMIGATIGGLTGGIAAARAGGDPEDIVAGVLVGSAVGGFAALTAAIAGPAASAYANLAAGSLGAGLLAGSVSGVDQRRRDGLRLGLRRRPARRPGRRHGEGGPRGAHRRRHRCRARCGERPRPEVLDRGAVERDDGPTLRWPRLPVRRPPHRRSRHPSTTSAAQPGSSSRAGRVQVRGRGRPRVLLGLAARNPIAWASLNTVVVDTRGRVHRRARHARVRPVRVRPVLHLGVTNAWNRIARLPPREARCSAGRTRWGTRPTARTGTTRA